MLVKFKFKNYKSYKDLQEFSMIAGTTKSYEERLFKQDRYSLLKFGAIYGANGSGKTSIIDALSTMQKLVVIGIPDYIRPIYFKLDEESKNEPTYFETYLTLNEKIYSYGFEYNSFLNKFMYEWLVEIKGKREIELYTRDFVTGSFEVDNGFNAKSDKQLQVLLNLLKNNDKQLFLTFINSNNVSEILEKCDELKMVFDWFRQSLSITSPDAVLTSGEFFIVEKKITQLASLLDAFNTGIKSIDSIPVDVETAFQNIPADIINDLKSDIDKKENIKSVSALLRSTNGLWLIKSKGRDLLYEKVCFYHDKEKKYPFYITEESEGTIRIIDLAGTLLTEKNNQLFVIDELDRKLHPQLTCKFIQMFLDKSKKCNNQLIVTTHESRLLDFSILRRDEIWFSNKNEHGESKVYSLEEYNVRFDKKIDKAYLDGRYGGVPIFDTVFPTIEQCQE